MKSPNFVLEITTKKLNKMKKLFLTILCFSALSAHASELIDAITMTKVIKGGSRTEVSVEPEVGYDGENNSVEIVIEAEQSFQMRVIDIYGTVVYTCPVLMVDGTPTNYQLPELPAGIYTLKVESPDVSYEGTLVIE